MPVASKGGSRSLVVVDELHKQFGETKVLRGVNLTVEEGDVVAVIGRSGSGKSTFLRILNGLETFDAGFVKIDGDRVHGLENDLRPLRLKVGMVFQQFNLFPHLTAGENVMLAPRIVKKEPEAEVRELAAEMLARVGLRQPLLFAGGVANNPCVVHLLSEALGSPPFIPDQPEMVGAHGAAFHACR